MNVATTESAVERHVRGTWADGGEIDTFDGFVVDFHAGRIDPAEFRRFRLQYGIYGQRQPDVQMLRVKIPWGGLTATQLERLADIAARTPRGLGHVTTRQNMQFHFVPLPEVPELMRSLAAVGLTTREACGNTVRNVTVGHCAGICAAEPFDPTPYAEAVARFLLRNPMNQQLPRKFKIAFSGCADDTGLTRIHDVGARAAVHREACGLVRGFEIVLGGGLGPAPHAALLLEPFTPATELLATIAAVVRVFDRHGNRENRNLARLKFVVKRLGIDAVRELVLRERDEIRRTIGADLPDVTVWEERPPTELPRRASVTPRDAEYERWRQTSVVAQRQPGWASVNVRLVRGDATAEQLMTLAAASREFGDSAARTTNQQNVVLRWIPLAVLPELYARLAPLGLALPGAERLIDVTSCPGADTCQLGITSSRGLAGAIADVLDRELGPSVHETELRIKISGCPNSCGQHHLADIGLFGGARKFHGEQAPAYQLLVGARATGPGARFAAAVARVPAKLAPRAVHAIVSFYLAERRHEERLADTIDRVGLDRVRALVEPWTELPPVAQQPDAYLDWDAEEPFVLATGPGECAA